MCCSSSRVAFSTKRKQLMCFEDCWKVLTRACTFLTRPKIIRCFRPCLLSAQPSNIAFQVARQLSSAVGYVTSMAHAMWDVHTDDVMVECTMPHVIILDMFMVPNESLFSKNVFGRVFSWFRDLVFTFLAFYCLSLAFCFFVSLSRCFSASLPLCFCTSFVCFSASLLNCFFAVSASSQPHYHRFIYSTLCHAWIVYVKICFLARWVMHGSSRMLCARWAT